MVDELENIEDELKKLELEDEFFGDEQILRELATPSAADYWKKRMEEEKTLWDKTMETKEQEKKTMESKLTKTTAELSTLREEIKRLKQNLTEETLSWQERLKAKEMELILEKEKTNWDQKYREFEYKNRYLQEEIKRIKDFSQQEKENLKTTHRKETEEFLTTQNDLVKQLELVDQEINQMQDSWKKQLSELEQESKRQAEELPKIIQNKNQFEQENSKLKNILESHTQQKKICWEHLGTISGVVSHCLSRFRLPKIVKKQLAIVNETVTRILEILQ